MLFGYDIIKITLVNRGVVKWYDCGLQNRKWGFDSLIPCHAGIKTNRRGMKKITIHIAVDIDTPNKPCQT